MKYGLFSDVHSNLEAFQKVLEAFEREKVDRYVFLGDIVGYNADPKRCIQLLKDLIKVSGCACIAGNHDYAVCGLTKTDNYNPYARAAVEWTKKQLDASDTEFLKRMKLVERLNGFTIVHAELTAPQKWGYIFDIDDAYPSFKMLKDQVCFIGHSHRPVVFSAGEMINWSLQERVVLQKDMRYIINIGSVGQPRDGNPESSYAVYDADAGVIELKHSGYDIGKAQEKVIRAGLPKILAERLSIGR